MKPLTWLLWVSLGLGALLVFAQFTGLPTVTPVTQVLSFYPWLALLLLVIVVGCLVTRQLLLGCLSVGLTAIVAWTFFTATLSGPPMQEANGEEITVVAANVLKGKATAQLAERLVAEPADLVLISECTPACAAILRSDKVQHLLPHQLVSAAPGPNGSAILSAWPLTPVEQAGAAPAEDRSVTFAMPVAVVDLPNGATTVRVAHPVPPVPGVVGLWADDLRMLADFANAVSGLLIVGGDFNATIYHRQFRDVLGAGALTDAIPNRPGTWPTDWPTGERVPIDHILVSADFRVQAADTWELPDSDHLAVRTQIGMNSGDE